TVIIFYLLDGALGVGLALSRHVVHLKCARCHVIYESIKVIAALGTTQYFSQPPLETAPDPLPDQTRDRTGRASAISGVRHPGNFRRRSFDMEVRVADNKVSRE